jgi:hypothetical protein
MSAEPQEIDVASLFGEANLVSAKAIFDQLKEMEPDIDGPSIRKGFQESVIKESIDLINWRTSGQNDPGFLAGLLTWVILGEHYLSMGDVSNVPIRDVVYFISLSEVMNNPKENRLNEDIIKELYEDEESSRYIFSKCITNFFSRKKEE